ncbi:MAG: PLP-dependent aminotransferase family protein [Bacteroidia bacterium]
MKPKKEELLYLRIAKSIEHQIQHDILKVGDKLPSIRSVCREHGVSMSTVLQSYYDLEGKGLIEARPQSGFYVCNIPRKLLALPKTSKPDSSLRTGDIDELVTRVYNNLGTQNKNIRFSTGGPDNDLFPISKLNKGLVQAMRTMEGSGVAYEHPLGNEKLRQQIARWSFSMGADLAAENIITTSGCLNAISFCLMALTKAGDTIALESPISFGMIQVALSLKLQILELPTNPKTGIELDALKKAFASKKIKLCLLISNFSNPLGCCMPDESKKELVKMLEHYNIPLIENDLNGDIYFGSHRPKSCKTFDRGGLVLWCGSISKSLAPGYRVGWVEAGQFREQIIRMKSYHLISSTSITQEVIANFLETGRYETHLRKLRYKLYSNYSQYIRSINNYFPQGTKASRPEGGSVLWVEFNKKINTVELYERAIQHQISIAPGKMFTLQNQFSNCMRLTFGLNWNEKTEGALKTIGRLAETMM